MGWLKSLGKEIKWNDIKKPIAYGGITAATLGIGGAIAGTAVLGSAAGISAAVGAGLQGIQATQTEKANKKAQALYQQEVDQANATALAERKDSLEKLRKKYAPATTTFSSYQGTATGNTGNSTGIILG